MFIASAPDLYFSLFCAFVFSFVYYVLYIFLVYSRGSWNMINGYYRILLWADILAWRKVKKVSWKIRIYVVWENKKQLYIFSSYRLRSWRKMPNKWWLSTALSILLKWKMCFTAWSYLRYAREIIGR